MKPATHISSAQQLWPSQLMALHSLFRVYAPRFLGRAGLKIERKERLAWASDIVLRPVTSFYELRSDEAARLIDFMKLALGQEVTPPDKNFYRRRPDRDQARAYGTAGRRGNPSNEVQLVDAPTLALVDRLVAQLGWDRARFDAFLHSKHSPVRSGAIRTLPEANGVIWALRKMLRRAGAEEFPSSRSDQSSFDFARQREEG